MRNLGWICFLLAATLCPAQVISKAAVKEPTALLAKAREAMGFANVGDRVLHYQASGALLQPYQSDRTYAPFFSAFSQEEAWFNPLTGVFRIQTQTQWP